MLLASFSLDVSDFSLDGDYIVILNDSTILHCCHLAEVEGVGPDMDEAVEGDENQEHNQDGHDNLVN